MSLAEPTIPERAVEFLKSSPHRKIVLWVLLALVALGGFLFILDRVGSWRDQRSIDRKRAEVNAALANLANAQQKLQADKLREAELKQDVVNKTQRYLDAVNATDAARAETNRALQNLGSAVNANRNIGITAEELEKRLKEASP